MRCLWCFMLLALNSGYAQSNRFLPGTWEGIHKMEHIKDSTYVSITIEQVTGRTFSGASYGYFFENPEDNYYRGRITGRIEGDRITIDILRISDKKLADYPGFYWCTGRSTLILQKENGAYVMTALQDPDGCLTGAMRLRKKERPVQPPPVREKYTSRRNILAQTISLQNKQFRIALYDNGTIDGDTVSIYFNGQLLTDRQPLNSKPFVIDLEASDTADNELIMYAENEGRVPPNTALMVIYADDKSYRVKLNAGNHTNAMVRFLWNRKP